MKVGGTCDVAIIPLQTPKVACIVDWKFGRAEPSEASITLQLACYALGLHEQLPHFEKVVCIAYYPRLERKYVVEITDFEKTRAQVEAVVQRCEMPDAPLVPGQEQCRYCRALHDCPAVESSLQVVHAKESLPASPREMARRLEFGALAEKWYERQKEVAKQLIADGMDVPGYALITRRGNLYVADPQRAYEAVSQVVTPEEMLSVVDVKINKLREVFAAKFPELSKKEVDARFENALCEVLKRKPDITYVGRVRRE